MTVRSQQIFGIYQLWLTIFCFHSAQNADVLIRSQIALTRSATGLLITCIPLNVNTSYHYTNCFIGVKSCIGLATWSVTRMETDRKTAYLGDFVVETPFADRADELKVCFLNDCHTFFGDFTKNPDKR